MSLTLILLPCIHASDTTIELPVSDRAQAVAVVQAYGIDRLDHAALVRYHKDVTDGSPYEELMTLHDFITA
ncbi:hypothetical protein HWB52_gp33 [Pseudomonas phage Littlefix]|uniref:Uncharacterized protein n=1 Tax=Pseudomonas phage Littlefix TaxID=2079289 RepID=A0A2K9VHT4_9CAUD|nr:hypothetical protein HWB52_gp33 [Pseudomonas phage Littlefix]AUV61848.1 hypothetical protein PsPhLittlefix_gp33 [Pseudomonas phage Littlefix]